MAQAIKNIKAGQRFKIIDASCYGFEVGCIVEALADTNVIKNAGKFKHISGQTRYVNNIFYQNIEHLKRFKGKIK